MKDLCNAAELHEDVEASPFLGKRDTNGKKNQRYSDLIIHNLSRRRGSSLVIDVSIASSFSQVGGSNHRPLAAAALNRETDKTNKYTADCSKLNLAFHPCDDGCLWWDSTQHSTVCSQSPHPQGQELCTSKQGCTHTAKAYWYKRFSVTLWTFNAYKIKPQPGIY